MFEVHICSSSAVFPILFTIVMPLTAFAGDRSVSTVQVNIRMLVAAYATETKHPQTLEAILMSNVIMSFWPYS